MKMKKIERLFVVLIAVFLFLGGCAGPRQVKEIERICLDGLSKAKALEVSEEVLRDMNFTVAKADPNLGYVLSRPLAGGQLFEFWRKDNVGGFNAAEANLHSIRRTVEMNIDEEYEKLCINCRVKVERLSLSEFVESDVGIKYDRITGQKIRMSLLKLELDAEQKEWIELGEDGKLATVILQRIEKKTAKQ